MSTKQGNKRLQRFYDQHDALINSPIEEFEVQYSLTELYAIVDLNPKDAPNHPLRAPANEELKVINRLLHAMKETTNITYEQYIELLAEYSRLSQAVGIINQNRVDHTRVTKEPLCFELRNSQPHSRLC